MKNIVNAIRQANYIFIIGNGGSASLADHFATDLVKVCGVKAVSLCANSALVTAYANDTGYQNIFSYQLKVFMKPNDLLITISGSGTSKNIVKAIEFASKRGYRVCSFPTMKERNCSMEKVENIHLKLAHKIIARIL